MRRILIFLVLLAAAGCGPKKPLVMAAAPPAGRIVYSDPSVSPGVSGAVGEVVYLSGGTSAWVKAGTSNTAWQTFPGSGGGTTYTPGQGIAIDGGVINNSAPLVSHYTFAQPNSSATPVNTYEFLNDYTSNTAGSETAEIKVTVPYLGVQIPLRIDSLNAKGRQTSTTSGSTPSVTFNPRSDLLVITVGADATSLTISGLSTDTDYSYTMRGEPVAGGSAITAKPNNVTGGWFGLTRYSNSTSGSSISTTNATSLGLSTPDSATTGVFKMTLSGVASQNKAAEITTMDVEGGARYMLVTQAYSTATTDVSSIVITGTIKTGCVFTLTRDRATVN